MTGQKKILVVDDDPKILKALDQALRKEGYDVFRAADGEEALQVVRSSDPDLIILDIMLPKLDGFEVCAKLRTLSNVPVLILSARGEEMDKVVGFNVGADDYLTKPFRLSELVLRVRAILRRTGPVQPGAAQPVSDGAPIRFRDMEINRAAAR